MALILKLPPPPTPTHNIPPEEAIPGVIYETAGGGYVLCARVPWSGANSWGAPNRIFLILNPKATELEAYPNARMLRPAPPEVVATFRNQ